MEIIPNKQDFAPYYLQYIQKVPSAEIVTELDRAKNKGIELLESILDEQWEFKYAEEKWTPKEILLHLSDSERIFAYRALRIAREDTTPLLGFDHNAFVVSSLANQRTPASLIAEFLSVRNATIDFFRSLTNQQWQSVGEANGQPASVVALAYIICGHQLHHFEILNEKYLKS